MATKIISNKLNILIIMAVISIIKEKEKNKCKGNCIGCSGCSNMREELIKEYYKNEV